MSRPTLTAQGTTVCLAMLAVLATPATGWLARGATAALLAVAIGVVHLWASRRVHRDLEALEFAALRLGNGDLDTIVVRPQCVEFALLAGALETARGGMNLRCRLLTQQRDGLADHLSRAEDRLTDPQRQRRREKIARINDLRATMRIADESFDVALMDVGVEEGVFALKQEDAAALVPGLPVRLHIHCDGEQLRPEGAVVAVAPTRGTVLHLSEWVFRFEPPLAPSALPLSVRAAIDLRAAERLQPTADNPAACTLICALGPITAQVSDLSESGVGLWVSLDERRAGRLGTDLSVRLHLPGLGAVAVLDVRVRNMTVRGARTRLGLMFTDTNAADIQYVLAWLRRAESDEQAA